MNHLYRLSILGAEGGPERLVAPHDLLEAALQHGDVDGVADAEGRGQVVKRAPAIQLVEEPQPRLGEGDGKDVLQIPFGGRDRGFVVPLGSPFHRW
ncbi:MAG: hypothetical protein QM820_26710 [Minicystis sp.]